MKFPVSYVDEGHKLQMQVEKVGSTVAFYLPPSLLPLFSPRSHYLAQIMDCLLLISEIVVSSASRYSRSPLLRVAEH